MPATKSRNPSQVNVTFRRCQTALASALPLAVRVGRLLRETQQGMKAEKWSSWLRRNFDGTAAEAERLILLAERWETLPEKSKQSSSFVRRSLQVLVGKSRVDLEASRSPEDIEDAIVALLLAQHEELSIPVVRKILRVAEQRLLHREATA